jgi:hypothetical protein
MLCVQGQTHELDNCSPLEFTYGFYICCHVIGTFRLDEYEYSVRFNQLGTGSDFIFKTNVSLICNLFSPNYHNEKAGLAIR